MSCIHDQQFFNFGFITVHIFEVCSTNLRCAFDNRVERPILLYQPKSIYDLIKTQRYDILKI